MKLVKSLLLGSATAIVATSGNAADLPTSKAAPVQYVKVCDAYGAGFFYIPGTETCIKVGGRVRADFAMSGRANAYATNVYAPGDGSNIVSGYVYNAALTGSASTALSLSSTNNYTNGSSFSFSFSASGSGTYSYSYSHSQNNTSWYTSQYTSPYGASGTSAQINSINSTLTKTSYGYVAANGIDKRASNIYGWEARARVDLDARTATGFGTVQAVASLRMARTTGVLDQQGPALSASSAGPTLEAAYIRFAGFTFGVAKVNFSFMPSTFYGAGHWSSFANGAKQIAYTAVLGGGVSATLAVQDLTDTTLGGFVVPGVNANGLVTGVGINAPLGSVNGTPVYSYNQMPQLNGRIDLDQAWGTASVMGAVSKVGGVNVSDAYNEFKTAYAVGAGLKLNLSQIAAGDVLWLNAAYAQGMTEYTTNWTSFKSSDTKRNVGGYVTNHPSWIATADGIELLKSWDVAAIYTHFWAPQWRHSILASYGAVDGTATSKALAWGQAGAYGDAKVWNVGTQLTFLPTKDFEIGVDVLYARVEQDIRRLTGYNNITTTTSSSSIDVGTYTSTVTREKAGNWTGRLRVERTF